VRRALGDALDRLASLSADLVVKVLDMLIQDQDPYVRQRAWRTLLQLADLYPTKPTSITPGCSLQLIKVEVRLPEMIKRLKYLRISPDGFLTEKAVTVEAARRGSQL